MAQNPNGTVQCDRCDIYLEGFGALYGLVSIDIGLDGNLNQRIFCYQNSCRTKVLSGLVLLTPTALACTTCGVAFPARVASFAMLTNDLDTDGSGESRTMAFCYVNGHRDRLLSLSRI